MSNAKYRWLAANPEVKVLYMDSAGGKLFHVKTNHVPRKGDKIYLEDSQTPAILYNVGDVVWNPMLILKKLEDENSDVEIDYAADCVIMVSWS